VVAPDVVRKRNAIKRQKVQNQESVMVNKEKLLLLATIYMLVPGAMPDALADSSDAGKVKEKKASAVSSIKKRAPAPENKGALKK
jgi:hypothetical protein